MMGKFNNKYRAWDKIEKKMCEVKVINFEKGAFLKGNSPTPDTLYEDHIVSGTEEGHFVEFNDLELMQWTQLTTKNDIEIYEGDIVKLSNGKTATIIFEPEQGGFIAEWEYSKNQHYCRFTCDEAWVCELIGNIYQSK